MKKRIVALILASIMVMSLLAGCGGQEADAPAVSNEGREDLIVALNAKYPTLDPNQYPTDISRLVVEELLKMNYSTGEVEECLAESYEISEDGKTWTLHLREDVTFHDGTPMTAKDVMCSIDLIKDSPNAYAYENVVFTQVGDYEITMEFPEYTNLLKYDVSIPIFCADKYEELGYDAYMDQLIGTGPYVLESYDAATGIAVLQRNENYWGEPGKLKTITFKIISDANTRIIALESGAVDFAQIDASVFSTAKNSQKLDVAYGAPVLAYFLVFNTSKYPTSEPQFRQAISYAIDRELVASVSEVEGNYEIESAFYANAWGEKPDGITEYPYDVEKAKSLLGEIGLENGYDLGTVSILPDHKNMMEVIQQNLAEIGITFKIELLESVAHRDALRAGNFLLGISAGTDINVSPVYTFYSYFNSGMNPFYHYQNAEIDALADTVFYAIDQDEVKDAMEELMLAASEDALYGMLHLNGRLFAHTKGLNCDMSDNRNRHFENFYWEA